MVGLGISALARISSRERRSTAVLQRATEKISPPGSHPL
jgi:hypothetical protein